MWVRVWAVYFYYLFIYLFVIILFYLLLCTAFNFTGFKDVKKKKVFVIATECRSIDHSLAVCKNETLQRKKSHMLLPFSTPEPGPPYPHALWMWGTEHDPICSQRVHFTVPYHNKAVHTWGCCQAHQPHEYRWVSGSAITVVDNIVCLKSYCVVVKGWQKSWNESDILLMILQFLLQ